MSAPLPRCSSLPCSWLKGTKLCTIFGHHASNYATILGRVRRGQTGADGSSREQRGAEGGWWRGRVLVEGGSGHDWHQAVACGPASLARHHPVLTSGTWGHPHYHCFRVSTIHGDFHKIGRSRVAFSLLKVPSSSFTQ